MRRWRLFPRFALAAFALAALAMACGGDDDDDAPATTTAASPTAAATAAPTAAPTQDPNVYANPQLLTETAALNGKLSDKSIVVVDLRTKEKYEAGHIPGAVWYDSSKLKDPDEKLFVIRDTLFAGYLGDLGIDNTKSLVIYDDNQGLSSTRFWWVLWYYGHDKASVLNGGFQKWQRENLPTSKDTVTPVKATFKTAVNDKVVCALDYVQKNSAEKNPNVVILDVRSTAEFTGTDVRAAKGGHVPNSVNLDWTRSMTTEEPKVWKPAAELRKQFESAGIKAGVEVITYCQTGVRAAHSLFTLRLVGMGAGNRLYDGSWAEWGNDTKTAVER